MGVKEQLVNLESQVEFDGFEIGLEDIFGRRRFFVELASSEFYPYEKKYLSSNLCGAILPMYFLKLDDKERIYYDFTGLVQLKDYIKGLHCNQNNRFPTGEKIHAALLILDQLFKGIRDAENCLLFMERYRLQKDMVFINPQTRELKIAYFPETATFLSPQKKLMACIEDINKGFQDTEVNYSLKSLLDTILNENLGMDGMIRLIGKMLRDSKITYAKDK